MCEEGEKVNAMQRRRVDLQDLSETLSLTRQADIEYLQQIPCVCVRALRAYRQCNLIEGAG